MEKSGKDEAVSGPTGGGEETDALFSHASASPDPLPSIGSKMEWPESAVPLGVDPSSPDWIAKAMSRALDKYEDSFGTAHDRGDRLDSKF